MHNVNLQWITVPLSQSKGQRAEECLQTISSQIKAKNVYYIKVPTIMQTWIVVCPIVVINVHKVEGNTVMYSNSFHQGIWKFWEGFKEATVLQCNWIY